MDEIYVIQLKQWLKVIHWDLEIYHKIESEINVWYPLSLRERPFDIYWGADELAKKKFASDILLNKKFVSDQ